MLHKFRQTDFTSLNNGSEKTVIIDIGSSSCRGEIEDRNEEEEGKVVGIARVWGEGVERGTQRRTTVAYFRGGGY